MALDLKIITVKNKLKENTRSICAISFQKYYFLHRPTKYPTLQNFFNGFLARWNDIEKPLYYVSNRKLFTIQYLLQKMLNSASETKKLIEAGLIDASQNVEIPIEPIRFAMAVIGAIPVFLLFPYLQKYYAKGIAVGSTKG